MKRRFFAAGGVLVLGLSAFAKFLRRSTPANPTRIHRGKRWICLKIDLQTSSLDLYWAGADAKPLRTFEELEQHVMKRGRRVVIAMNAGMFEDDGSPVGWCVTEGTTVKGPNTNEGTGNFFLKPNGVFAVKDGRALVRETTSAAGRLENALLVTQSGPLLVSAGEIHPAFREDSSNRHIRNAVGVTEDGAVWLVISEEPVSFHETATLFRDELQCPDALFLDGAVSRLHAPDLGYYGGNTALGPFLAVTEAYP